MSKLYVKAETDAVKTARTARGHHDATVKILFNFGGGRSPDGEACLTAIHLGDHIEFGFTVETNGMSEHHNIYTVRRPA